MLKEVKEILKPWCVLVVDDSPEDRTEIRRMLLKGSDRRLSFIEAGTAEAGVKAVMGAPQPPDCILLDYNLPEMDAPDVLAALSGPHGLPVCAVVVITGGTSREHGRRALRAGAQDYIGKDWSNPHALSRAVENACEIWAMARELREREEALRLVAVRETFRSAFRNATRDLGDECVVKRVASRLLGEHLNADRIMYGELVGEGNVWVGQSDDRDMPQNEGNHKLGDYGPQRQATLMSGENIVVNDVRVDGAYSESEKAAHAQLEIVAILGIPILKNGSLVAVLSIHQKTPRVWRPEDIAIAREIGESTWAAVEHARAEQSLRAKDLQLAQMVQIMPSFSAVLTGPTFVFQMANQAYFDLVGRGSEIIGKAVLEAFPELADQPFPALLEEVYRTGKPFEAKSMVFSLRRGPGETLSDIFIDFSYLPLRAADGQVMGVFVHGADRTAEVRSAQALARRERELHGLAENTPDVLTRYDRQFRHLFVNSAIEKNTGHPVAAILGKTLRELGTPEPLCDDWEQAISDVFDHGEHRSLEFSWPNFERLRYFSCRLVPEINESGQVESVLGVTRDITDKMLIELILLDKNAELERAIAIAEKASLGKSEFLSSMSHELRTPLNAILGFAQLLEAGSPPPTLDQKRSLEQILRAGWYLLELINEILDLAQIDSGKIMLSPEQVSLVEVLRDCQTMVAPLADNRGIAITCAPLDSTYFIEADRTRAKQVLINLLSNAIKYNRPGGAVIIACALVSPDSIRISIQDTGFGMTPKQLAQLFQPFNRLGRESGPVEGTGIGLVVTKRLIELMGGAIGVDSTVGVGSVFWIEFKLTTAPQLAIPETRDQVPERPKVLDGTPKRTLLHVEDNAASVMLIEQILAGRADLSLLSVADGNLGIEFARAHQPDVILMDINLPGINGIEAMKILRADPLTAQIPIIAVSANALPQDIEMCLAVGFFDYLTKPIRLDEFLRTLDLALKLSESN